MLYYFPTLLPDEKLSHGWARYAERSAYSNASYAFWDLFAPFNKAHYHHRFEKFETHIDAFVSNLPHDFPYTSDYLIDNHTLYPLYSFTLFKSRAIEFKSAMKGHKKPWRGGPSLIKPHTWFPRFARYCIECAKEDIAFYGETYWHRLHQIPDIDVCGNHQCWLENTDLPLDNRDGIGFMTAGQYIDLSRQAKYFDCQDGDYEYIQLLFTKAAKYFLNHPLHGLYLEEMLGRYKSRLYEKGVSTVNGSLYRGTWINYIRSKVKPHILQKLQNGLYGFEKIWSTSLVPGHTIVPPTIHFLFMYFLDISPKSFVEHSAVISPFGPGPWPCMNPACKNFNKLVIRTFQLSSFGRNGYGIFTCECGSQYKLKFNQRSEDQLLGTW